MWFISQNQENCNKIHIYIHSINCMICYLHVIIFNTEHMVKIIWIYYVCKLLCFEWQRSLRSVKFTVKDTGCP